MTFNSTIKRALISVSDKTNIVPFAKNLQQYGIEILSTGGTAKLLKKHGVNVIDVSEYTQFPEMMDGRLKTLHPKIHGGILSRRDIDKAAMEAHNLQAIDLVVVNLYPFQETIQQPDCTLEKAIDNIDIGGPTMLRAAAKNHRFVSVIVCPTDYDLFLTELHQNNSSISSTTRYKLATKAFQHTANYDNAIAEYLQTQNQQEIFSEKLNQPFILANTLRYGENPHQQAAFYRETPPVQNCIANAKQLQGKQLSFNNLVDSDAAFECVKKLKGIGCVIVKHANPCGAAIANTPLYAYQRAYECDPISSFGGIIAFNSAVDPNVIQAILSQQFVEVIIAPEFNPEAIEIAKTKPNVRLLATGTIQDSKSHSQSRDFKRITGGLLIQDFDNLPSNTEGFKVVTKIKPSQKQLEECLFAWEIVRFVKSNAIVYTKNKQTIGIGAGQMARVFSAQIAHNKAIEAKLNLNDAVLASDAFFPFRDSIDFAAKLGIKTIIQPGGSMRDNEVIDACNEHDISMIFTNIRHFRH